MTENIDIRALAHLVHVLRPEWPKQHIETVLAKDARPLDQLTFAAIAAATNPKTLMPEGIKTTLPSVSGECSKCANKRSAPPMPPETCCPRCRQWFVRGEQHTCEPVNTEATETAKRKCLETFGVTK